jgi:FkbM family methyltransferase
MPQNPLRKAFQTVGIDIHRYQPKTDRLTWLKDLSISSVFDVGANIGQFATEIREALPQAQIYSFEPLEECYNKLTATFKNDQRFMAFNCALGESESVMTINKSAYTPSSSLRPMANSHKELFPHTKESAPEIIKIRTLDEVFAELTPKPEILVKVDTQGYEDKVIAGGSKALSKAKVVLIEACFVELYEGQPLFDEIYEKMKLFGLTYQGALHQKIDPATGRVIFEDAIFVR